MRCYQLFRISILTWLLSLNLHAQPARLLIERGPAPIKLGIAGAVGGSYIIEQSSNPGAPGSWEFLLGFTLTKTSQQWTDSSSLMVPQRFYRLVSLAQPPETVAINDFRLIDHEGKSRELYYYSTQRAIVLMFSDNASAADPQRISVIKDLRDQFGSQGVLFWMIDANPQDSRPSLTAQASASDLNLPILHDRAQLVARALGATATPEVIGINPSDWTVFYRGAIDDRVGSEVRPATQNYLATALANFLSGQLVPVSRTVPGGRSINLVPRRATSYSADIAPLLQNKCVRCHSPGNIAPWTMTNYAAVHAYSGSIKTEVLAGRMPPWHADPLYGEFTNDVSLKPQEARMLLDWIHDGSPRGDGPDLLANDFASNPPVTNYPLAWPPELGQPDFIVTIPRQSIPATGEVNYKYPQVVAQIPSNVWLRAAVVLPGNTRAVHHSLVFTGSLLEVVLNAGGLNGFFAGYVPGANPVTFPAGTGKFLPKNSSLTFQMHYTTTGKAETDQTKLGLYFMQSPPPLELLTRAAATLNISIPAGAQEYEREAEMIPSATKDVWLYEMSPHMHYRGSRFKYEAFYPNGTSEVLLSVPKYDFHWQALYRLTEPKRLPAGTIVRCTGAFDNSAQNRDNPNPAAAVAFGEQTDDEMFIGYLNYSVIP